MKVRVAREETEATGRLTHIIGAHCLGRRWSKMVNADDDNDDGAEYGGNFAEGHLLNCRSSDL